jgi:hypothetical protein
MRVGRKIKFLTSQNALQQAAENLVDDLRGLAARANAAEATAKVGDH